MESSTVFSNITISHLFLLSLTLNAILISSDVVLVVTAYDPYDPQGNITIRWDVMMWTPDGYVAVVNITNNQIYRTVQKPGWKLGWTWAKREVIWSTVGAQAIDQGDCSRFKGNIPRSCAKRPTLQDLTAEVPPTQQVSGCCRGGILSSRYQDLDKSTAEFQISVGEAGTTNRTVRLPRNITFVVERGGYRCGPAKIVAPTRFTSPDGRRFTRAFVTWQVVCTYSALWRTKQAAPVCCVSLSSNYDHRNKIANCPTSNSCSCNTDHMCPVSINWQMMKMKGADWTVRVSITNYNSRMNYSDWTLLINHPAIINKLTKVLHANHKLLPSKTGEVIWGIKKDNDVISSGGSKGSTMSLVMQLYKSKSYYHGTCNINGDRCVMPF